MPDQVHGLSTYVVEESVMPSTNVVILAVDFYKQYGRWPLDARAIRRFATMNDSPHLLDKYERLEFTTQVTGDLIVDYTLKPKAIDSTSDEVKELWGPLLSSGRIEIYPPGPNGEIQAHYQDPSGAPRGNLNLQFK